MERQFGLPIVFVAALHAALLFGVNGGPRSPQVVAKASPPPISRPFPIDLIAEPPTEADVSEPAKMPKPALESPVFRSPEPPAVVQDPVFSIPVPTAALPGIDAKRFTFEPPGVLGGESTNIDGRTVFSSILLDNPPRARWQGTPVFPHEARREGLHGEVVVEFMVDEEGRVLEPRVVSSNHRIFEEPTLRAVSKWQFYPGKSHGRTVRFRMVVPVVFTVAD